MAIDLTQCGSYAADEFGEWVLLAETGMESLTDLMDRLRVTDPDTPYVKFAKSPQDAAKKWSKANG